MAPKTRFIQSLNRRRDATTTPGGPQGLHVHRVPIRQNEANSQVWAGAGAAIMPNEANWARTDRRRQEPPRPPEKLASFSHAHFAHIPLQLLSATTVTLISPGGTLGSFRTSISLETRRLQLDTPHDRVRFARFIRPGGVVGRSSLRGIPRNAEGPPLVTSRLAPQGEKNGVSRRAAGTQSVL